MMPETAGGTLSQTRRARRRNIHPISDRFLGRRSIEDHQVADDHA
jgi:hypothetical protein